MSTPFDFFLYQKGILCSDDVSLHEIGKNVGTPSYVYSSSGLVSPLSELRTGLNGLDYLICFALKSNSNLSILRLLAENGVGADVVSGGELFRAQKAQIPPEKTVFSGVGKTAVEMISALEYGQQGIFSFNVESIQELVLLNQIAMEKKTKARVALRYNPDVDAKTHPYIATGLKKNKFGLQKSEILKIIQNSHDFKNIGFKGLSIHIGSQIHSLPSLKEAFFKLVALINQVNSILVHPLEFADLGGGLGIRYKNEKIPSIQKYCELIQKCFGNSNLFKAPLKIILEPGRRISGNAGALITQILFRKKTPTQNFLIVDAGMNDLMRPALYQSYHEIVPLHFSTTKSRLKTTVVGPVCESADCFASQRMLPADLKPGDYLAILSAGAYGFSMANQYNSRLRSSEVLTQKGSFHVIRQRETYPDLIRGEIF